MGKPLKSANDIKRFYSLDVVRGIAALSVVLWHWQHFFYAGTEPGTFRVDNLPLYSWFPMLYTKGWLAVDLFFGLSGFIFNWLYSERIAKKNISFADFSILRFSRLYPLHLLTLLLVGVGQLCLHLQGRASFVYGNSDIKHLLLNLTFTSSWGLESGYSYNGPSWSVSTEVFLYLSFFFVCTKLPRNIFLLGFVSLLGFIFLTRLHSPIGRGVGSFYLGGCVYLCYQWLVRSGMGRFLVFPVLALCLTAWVGIGGWGIQGFEWLRLGLIDSIPSLARLAYLTANNLHSAAVIGVLFPSTILSLALLEPRLAIVAEKLSFIGDISYSSYLFHFPLQLAFHIILLEMNSEIDLYSPQLMAAFFVLLIGLSLSSYHFFEVPLQAAIRKRLAGRWPAPLAVEK